MFHNFAVGGLIKDVEQAEAACDTGLEIKSRQIVFFLVARCHSRFSKEKVCRGITLGMVWFRGERDCLGARGSRARARHLAGTPPEAG